MTVFAKRKKASFRPATAGILVGLIVFVIGFGVMLIMYTLWSSSPENQQKGLKGLFDYKASLWGDAVCLPLLTGAGAAYIMTFYRKILTKRRIRVPLALGIIGGIAGCVMQAQWVISDTTPLNWSIPEQHHFNFAGWYHAVFFIIICFFVTFELVCVIQIDATLKGSIFSHNKKENNIYSFCQFLIWFSGLLFLQLHYLDDYSEQFASWQIILFFSIAVWIVLTSFKLIVLKRFQWFCFLPVVFAVIISSLLSFVSVTDTAGCDTSLLFSSILVSSLYVYNSDNKIKMIWLALLFGSLVWLCQNEVSIQALSGNTLTAVVFFLIGTVVPFVISLLDYQINEKNNPYDNRKHVLVITVALIISASLFLLTNVNSISSIIKLPVEIASYKYEIGSILIGLIVPLYVIYTFNRIKLIEDAALDSKTIELSKMSQYLIYFALYTSALVLLINCLYFRFEITLGITHTIAVIVVIALAAFFCVLIKRVKNAKLSILVLVCCYLPISVYLLITGINNTSLMKSNIQSLFDTASFWIVIISIVLISCAITVFMSLSVMYNVSLIRQIELSRRISVSAIIIGVFCGLCYGIAAYQLLIIQTVFYMLQVLMVTIITFGLIPYLQASVLNPGGAVGILDNYSRSCVMQDGFLYSAVTTINPIITISIINGIVNEEYIRAGVIYILYSIMLTPLWSYCITNNVEHCHKKEIILYQLTEKTTSNREKDALLTQYKNLKTYLTIQNIIAIIAAMPYTVVFIIYTVFENNKDNNSKKTLFPE